MSLKFMIAGITFICLTGGYSYSQGTVRGKISDELGGPLIGATIMVKTGQSVSGTVTDLDGNYSLKIVSAGPQVVTISYIGYKSILDTINPQIGEVIVRNYGMELASSELGEITIVGRVSKGRESYMEKIKLNSGTLIDYISTETIKKVGDSNVASAVSRITGVSTFSGFVTVRGLGDRYIKTMLNGLRIPTLDPFTNNIKLDLFPANLIDNIIVNKTFSPDLSGDWAGAWLSIETKDYPEQFTLNFESSFGFNSNSTYRDIISSNRSKTDWLGFDNRLREITHVEAPEYSTEYGYREFAYGFDMKSYLDEMGIDENTIWTTDYTKLALVKLGWLEPAYYNDPDEINNAMNNFNSSTERQEALLKANADVIAQGESLANTWLTTTRKPSFDFSQSFSVGNQLEMFNRPLGYIFGLRYVSSSLYSDDSFIGRTTLKVDDEVIPDNYEYSYNLYSKEKGTNSVTTNSWSALINLAYKINKQNSVSLLFMPNIIGVDKARKDNYYSFVSGSPNYYIGEDQNYESRRQLVWQLKSNHFIPSLKMKVDFNASYTAGKSSEPDYRHLLYSYSPLTGLASGLYSLGYNTTFRVFRGLSENLFDSNLSAEIPFGNDPAKQGKLKIGVSIQKLVRELEQYFYYFPNAAVNDPVIDGNLSDYFSLDKYSSLDNEGFLLRFYNQLSGPLHNTIGISRFISGYAMTDFFMFKSVRISGGLRIEDCHLHSDIEKYYSLQLPENDERRKYNELQSLVNPGLNDYFNFLPSINIVYSIKQNTKSQVNLRANYSETRAYPSLREFTSFSDFDYSLLAQVTGNISLEQVKISNFDLRGEFFSNSGNNISLSLFYKDFRNHIELIRSEQFDVEYTWQNAEGSSVKGIELEGSLVLTKNLEFRANTTIVSSKTKLQGENGERSMYGQAPYIINAILTYSSGKMGLDAAVSYNLQGPKLVITSTHPDSPDVFELPRNIIDFRISKKFSKHFNLSFRIRDLLGAPQKRAYKFTEGWLDFDRQVYGTTYILGISFNI